MKLLITGASGIIGKDIHSYFLKNHELFLLSKTSKINFRNSTRLDLCNKKDVEKYVKNLEKFDVLIFLSGLAHKKVYKNRKTVYFEQNYASLINLLESLKLNKKIPSKIIFASTISVYGERSTIKNYDETIIPLPKNYYAQSKYKAENYLLNNYNSKSWILRFSPVYSDNFKLNIKRRTEIFGINFIVGDGSLNLSLCNINNIRRVIKNIIEDKIPRGVYNISDNEKYSYRELLNFQKTRSFLKVPFIFLSIIMILNKIIRSVYIDEICLKLSNSFIYPNDKLRRYVDLNNNLNS